MGSYNSVRAEMLAKGQYLGDGPAADDRIAALELANAPKMRKPDRNHHTQAMVRCDSGLATVVLDWVENGETGDVSMNYVRCTSCQQRMERPPTQACYQCHVCGMVVGHREIDEIVHAERQAEASAYASLKFANGSKLTIKQGEMEPFQGAKESHIVTDDDSPEAYAYRAYIERVTEDFENSDCRCGDKYDICDGCEEYEVVEYWDGSWDDIPTPGCFVTLNPRASADLRWLFHKGQWRKLTDDQWVEAEKFANLHCEHNHSDPTVTFCDGLAAWASLHFVTNEAWKSALEKADKARPEARMAAWKARSHVQRKNLIDAYNLMAGSPDVNYKEMQAYLDSIIAQSKRLIYADTSKLTPFEREQLAKAGPDEIVPMTATEASMMAGRGLPQDAYLPPEELSEEAMLRRETAIENLQKYHDRERERAPKAEVEHPRHPSDPRGWVGRVGFGS
jgi:hypothetical protein